MVRKSRANYVNAMQRNLAFENRVLSDRNIKG